MNCYNCGTELGREDFCQGCGANVKGYKKIIMASNAYYNDALAKAEVRDLSGAIESLKMSLKFYKLNINARNLLGLVYFERGEAVEALTEWVISKNYKPKDNIASRYLDEIQNNRARLDSINQTIKKYNQALLYCKQDSKDLAVIQLKKVLTLNPKLVSGHQLLALLYLREEKYDLAKKSLHNAAKIDANNTITLRYMKEVNQHLHEGGEPRKKKEEQVAYRSGNETIIQPKYNMKESSAMGTILNMVIGIAIGVAITCFLVVPGVRRDVQNKAKEEVLAANNAVSSKTQELSALQSQIEELTDQVAGAQKNAQGTEIKISSYDQLIAAYAAYVDGNIDEAGTALSNVNEEYLSESAKAVYGTINAQINEDYIKALYDEGYGAYNGQRFAEAAEALQKVVDMDETYSDGYALYYLAQAYRKNNDLETAKIYYQKISELYPGTERARNAAKYINIVQ